MSNSLWDSHDFRVIIGRTQIDYDPRKETRNRRKHHYSLESAVDLLGGLVLPGTYRPFISRPVRRKGEVRHEHITFDDSKNVVFFVTTMRDDETVRVISLRRAHENEIRLFVEHMRAMVHGHPQPVVPRGGLQAALASRPIENPTQIA